MGRSTYDIDGVKEALESGIAILDPEYEITDKVRTSLRLFFSRLEEFDHLDFGGTSDLCNQIQSRVRIFIKREATQRQDLAQSDPTGLERFNTRIVETPDGKKRKKYLEVEGFDIDELRLVTAVRLIFKAEPRLLKFLKDQTGPISFGSLDTDFGGQYSPAHQFQNLYRHFTSRIGRERASELFEALIVSS